MLVINANQEQKRVFNKLIQEMDAQVVWNGRFVIMGDRLILEGFIRSLFFHFDIQKTEVQFVDLPTDDVEEIEISDHPELVDLITMAVYAFEKWGTLKGVHVEQDVTRLDQIFAEILGAYDLETAFSIEKFEFYQSGMRITYEDVIETALKFTGVKLSGQRLKMPVIGQPEDEPQGISEDASSSDTDESGVVSAGADTATPSGNSKTAERIEKYHARISVLDRLSDMQKKALERDIRNDKLLSEEDKEELYYPIRDYERQKEMNALQSISRAGTTAVGTQQTAGMDGAGAPLARDSAAVAERIEKYHARIGVLDRLSDLQRKALERDIRNDKLLREEEKEELYYPIRDYERQKEMNIMQFKSNTRTNIAGTQQAAGMDGTGAPLTRDSAAVAERIEKYISRIGVLDRLSDLQTKALIRDIRNDRLLYESEKKELFFPIQDFEYQRKSLEIEEALKDKENGTYQNIKKMIKKIDQEELFEETKQAVLEKLNDLRIQLGIQEVKAIMEKVPQHVERAEYQELMENLAPYEDIDLGAYKERLRKMRETLEIKEISNMLLQSKKNNRNDYMKLLRDIEEKDFAEENAAPYLEQILDWVGELDEARLKKLVSNAKAMDFNTAASVYVTINRESFLPKLRADALAIISRRLEEISLNECRILVRALEKTMSGVIKENPRHHFYPAEKILAKTAKPEDVKLINSAVAAYAEKKGRFEYPLMMVDTSKECNGRDGMLLTSAHLFYSTRLNGYQIQVSEVKSIYVTTGLLKNRAVVVEEANGVKHKLPYAVEPEELKNWAKVLDHFVKFLQGRIESEKLSYEALEDEGAISCKRCGCIYHDLDVCPECGYKKNK